MVEIILFLLCVYSMYRWYKNWLLAKVYSDFIYCYVSEKEMRKSKEEWKIEFRCLVRDFIVEIMLLPFWLLFNFARHKQPFEVTFAVLNQHWRSVFKSSRL